MRLIDADALKADYGMADECKECRTNVRTCEYDRTYTKMDFCGWLDDAPTVSQWIPVKERLPENRLPILITDSEGDVRKGEYWSDNCWQCFVTVEEFLTIHDPVAWMPLPEPYKEKDNERT